MAQVTGAFSLDMHHVENTMANKVRAAIAPEFAALRNAIDRQTMMAGGTIMTIDQAADAIARNIPVLPGLIVDGGEFADRLARNLWRDGVALVAPPADTREDPDLQRAMGGHTSPRPTLTTPGESDWIERTRD